MKEYRYEFVFNDIDSNMNTQGEGSVELKINADDFYTATLIADRLQRVLGADSCRSL